ncbi:TPA: flagellar basal body-associated protein FliL [Salmonella enterica]|uniref:Flagellar protein FliL n=1 Tax=Salmonella enterica TaxID=28901 RepID=A0A756YCQ0_SALER|nr:flagellar basal body-associated protein FliL [Salmonella enterica subsp. enterica serovar Richmond]HAG0390724.1 flagellar basal body-associated protein FliL [Salmonella enterica]
MSNNDQEMVRNGKKNTLIILVVLFLLSGMGALICFFYSELENIKSQGIKSNPEETSMASNEVRSPVYISLEPFTVNLRPNADNTNPVLYIGLVVQVQDEKAKVLVEQFLPKIRSRLLMLFSQQETEALSTSEGKVKLIQDIKNTINDPVIGKEKIGVTDVFFNVFILR